jgi:hypothetical protein
VRVQLEAGLSFAPRTVPVLPGDTVAWLLAPDVSPALEFDVVSNGDVAVVVVESPAPAGPALAHATPSKRANASHRVNDSLAGRVSSNAAADNAAGPEDDDGATVWESDDDADSGEGTSSSSDEDGSSQSDSADSIPSGGIPATLDELPALGIGFTRKGHKRKARRRRGGSSALASTSAPTLRSSASSSSYGGAASQAAHPTFSISELAFDSGAMQLGSSCEWQWRVPDADTLRSVLMASGLGPHLLASLVSGAAHLQLRYSCSLYRSSGMRGVLDISLSLASPAPVARSSASGEASFSSLASPRPFGPSSGHLQQSAASSSSSAYPFPPLPASPNTPGRMTSASASPGGEMLSRSSAAGVSMTPKRLEAVSPSRHLTPSRKGPHAPSSSAAAAAMEDDAAMEEKVLPRALGPAGSPAVHASVALLSPKRQSSAGPASVASSSGGGFAPSSAPSAAPYGSKLSPAASGILLPSSSSSSSSTSSSSSVDMRNGGGARGHGRLVTPPRNSSSSAAPSAEAPDSAGEAATTQTLPRGVDLRDAGSGSAGRAGYDAGHGHGHGLSRRSPGAGTASETASFAADSVDYGSRRDMDADTASLRGSLIGGTAYLAARRPASVVSGSIFGAGAGGGAGASASLRSGRDGDDEDDEDVDGSGAEDAEHPAGLPESMSYTRVRRYVEKNFDRRLTAMDHMARLNRLRARWDTPVGGSARVAGGADGADGGGPDGAGGGSVRGDGSEGGGGRGRAGSMASASSVTSGDTGVSGRTGLSSGILSAAKKNAGLRAAASASPSVASVPASARSGRTEPQLKPPLPRIFSRDTPDLHIDDDDEDDEDEDETAGEDGQGSARTRSVAGSQAGRSSTTRKLSLPSVSVSSLGREKKISSARPASLTSPAVPPPNPATPPAPPTPLPVGAVVYLRGDGQVFPSTVKLPAGHSLEFRALQPGAGVPTEALASAGGLGGLGGAGGGLGGKGGGAGSLVHPALLSPPPRDSDIVTTQFRLEVNARQLGRASGGGSAKSTGPGAFWSPFAAVGLCTHEGQAASKCGEKGMSPAPGEPLLCGCITRTVVEFPGVGVYEWKDEIYPFVRGTVLVMPEGGAGAGAGAGAETSTSKAHSRTSSAALATRSSLSRAAEIPDGVSSVADTSSVPSASAGMRGKGERSKTHGLGKGAAGSASSVQTAASVASSDINDDRWDELSARVGRSERKLAKGKGASAAKKSRGPAANARTPDGAAESESRTAEAAHPVEEKAHDEPVPATPSVTAAKERDGASALEEAAPLCAPAGEATSKKAKAAPRAPEERASPSGPATAAIAAPATSAEPAPSPAPAPAPSPAPASSSIPNSEPEKADRGKAGAGARRSKGGQKEEARPESRGSERKTPGATSIPPPSPSVVRPEPRLAAATASSSSSPSSHPPSSTRAPGSAAAADAQREPKNKQKHSKTAEKATSAPDARVAPSPPATLAHAEPARLDRAQEKGSEIPAAQLPQEENAVADPPQAAHAADPGPIAPWLPAPLPASSSLSLSLSSPSPSSGFDAWGSFVAALREGRAAPGTRWTAPRKM